MSGFLKVVVMSFFLGLGSFGFGLLPLSFKFQKNNMARFSALGTGLLLGTALGVIIPEGIETLASFHPSSELPTAKIAFSLLIGFALMLVLEQSFSPLSQPHSFNGSAVPERRKHVLDSGAIELGQQSEERLEANRLPAPSNRGDAVQPQKAYPLTLGLILHGLTDGIALGVSGLSTSVGSSSPDLSLVVFIALLVHKAPTAFAYGTSLLSSVSLPVAECRRHVAIFSISTPVGAIGSYAIFSMLRSGLHGDWIGIALLVSGGTFLYVATVLQPGAEHGGVAEELTGIARIVYTVTGMFIPFIIGQVLGGHEHI